ncbi:unnamed protein product, partial [Rotaria socialis]
MSVPEIKETQRPNDISTQSLTKSHNDENHSQVHHDPSLSLSWTM